MTRPTFAVSSVITANDQTLTPPANTKGMAVFAHREGSHGFSGVSHGGVALGQDPTGDQADNPETGHDLHVCAWYIDDFAAWASRSGNVLHFTGGTLGGTLGDDAYRAHVVWVTHATNLVELAASAEGTPENVQTQPITLTVDPGVGVEAAAFLAATVAGFNYSGPFAGGQSDDYGPSQIDTDGNGTYRYGSHAAITGSTALGMNSSAGGNPHGAMVAQAWVQGISPDVLFAPSGRIRGEWSLAAGAVLEVPEDVLLQPTTRLRGIWATHPGAELLVEFDRQVVVGGYPPEGLDLTADGEEGDLLVRRIGNKPSWADPGSIIAVAIETGPRWVPVMDGYGNVVTDGGTGAAIMALVTD